MIKKYTANTTYEQYLDYYHTYPYHEALTMCMFAQYSALKNERVNPEIPRVKRRV